MGMLFELLLTALVSCNAFTLTVSSSSSKYDGLALSTYHLGAAMSFMVAQSGVEPANFNISGGHLVQTNLSSIPPGSFTGYFTSSFGILPLYVGASAGNTTFSEITPPLLGAHKSLAFNGNTNWFICDSTTGPFNTTVTGVVNLVVGSPTPSDCYSAQLLIVDQVLPTSTVQSTSTVHSTSIHHSTSTSSCGLTQFYLSVEQNGLQAGYLGASHIGAGINYGVVSNTKLIYQLTDNTIVTSGLGDYPAYLLFQATNGSQPLFINFSGGNSNKFAINSANQVTVGGQSNWKVCAKETYVPYTVSNVVNFAFGNGGSNCTSAILKAIPLSSCTSTTIVPPPFSTTIRSLTKTVISTGATTRITGATTRATGATTRITGATTGITTQRASTTCNCEASTKAATTGVVPYNPANSAGMLEVSKHLSLVA